MNTLESLKVEMQEKIQKGLKENKGIEEIEKELLHDLLDLRRKQTISIPELEELFKGVKSTTQMLKKKVNELRSITG